MPGSDAWQNMLAVFSGGIAESYRTPEYYVPFSPLPGLAIPIHVGWEEPTQPVDVE